jgi:hypothetical protein
MEWSMQKHLNLDDEQQIAFEIATAATSIGGETIHSVEGFNRR